MNNEPVAWMVAEMVFTIKESAVEMAKVYGDEIIPLYTHPADESFDRTASHMAGEYVSYPTDLTDKEILELTHDSSIFEYREFNDDMVRFARAILKKASEK